MNKLKTSAVAALSVATVGSPLMAMAGTYDALCSGTRCQVSVSADAITTPQGTIPTNRVTSWTGGGHSETDVTTGVVTTLVFGLPGLLGFGAKKHDYNFTVTGFTEKGRKTTLNIGFLNDKPAKRLMGELSSLTGLAMNEQRSKEEVEELIANGGESDTLEGAQLALAKPKVKCWSEYADSNPGMKTWANANPQLAAPVLSKYGAC